MNHQLATKISGDDMTIPKNMEAPDPLNPLLSLIIPAYNEQQRLPASLAKIQMFVAEQPFSIQVLVVDDGSMDRTSEIVGEFNLVSPYIELLKIEHGGKGRAVKAGMLKAEGEYLFLCDCDLSMPIDEVLKFLPPHFTGTDIAIGSREVFGAKRIGEPRRRHIMGRVFNAIVSVFLVSGIRDTQAGFKCFRKSVARDLFARQTLDGWGFDAEILYLAKKSGYRIVEIPITWFYKADSKIKPFRDSFRMLRDIGVIRRNNFTGIYDTRMTNKQPESVPN
jgi:glycosyltransferase involved in cell wall biosynthesis